MKAVNLLPAELRTGPSRSAAAAPPAGPAAFAAHALLGALALAALAMVAWTLTGNALTAKGDELARVRAEGQAVKERAALLKPYADFQASADERDATVRKIAGARFDWEQALRDVSRALPAGVSLSALSGDVGLAEGATVTSNPLRAAIAAPAIEMQGCTRSQTAVAETLARLRTIDGVTRVSLAKSDKGAGTADAGGSAPGRRPAPVPGFCGGGDLPTFDVVIFFEGAAEAVRSAPGAGGDAGAVPAAATPAPAASPAPAPSATPAAGSTASTSGGTP